jgi:TolB-like protein
MIYNFDSYRLDTKRRELRQGAVVIPLQPQVFDFLEFLLRNHDRVVSRDDILAAIWRGRIVSESTLASRINAARSAIGDSGEDQRLIRTIPRKGVRFVGGVREEPQAATERPRDNPSIAVLPFHNLSNDPQQEYFADGIVDEITTGLARIKWLLVIARGSSFTYKGKTINVTQVGRELGARYVLEGSVRKARNRVRITAQLVETAAGTHIWAECYDHLLDDIFEAQDERSRRHRAKPQEGGDRAHQAQTARQL